MIIRKSHSNSVSNSLQKLDINAQDINNQKINNESILSKLLRPPKTMQNKKLLLQRKYDPKFQKPDVQNLIHENVILKQNIQLNNQTISNLKLKNGELEKKVKFLEKGMEKYETVNQQYGYEKHQKAQQKSLTGQVHTEILKKKINDLTTLCISSQIQIKKLKKLPEATIYEQNDVQKQHLIAQTVRLKAIITSLSQELSNGGNQQKFHNHFMRLMKEENQKLKATIRLLQNDKTLLKSRQTIQNKINNDLKQQVRILKQKIQYKDAQLQKINNQNKNLLFKKANQFKLQLQKKQNEEIAHLVSKLTQVQEQNDRIQQNNQYLHEENVSLKQKQKGLLQQISQIQNRYEKILKNTLDQVEQLQLENNSLRNQNQVLLNTGSLKKKRSLAENIQSQNFYNKPIKINQIEISLLTINSLLQEKIIQSVQHIFKEVQNFNNNNGKLQVKCIDLMLIFNDSPFDLSKKEATKLARYITEDNNLPKILFDENKCIQLSLAVTILKSALNKIKESDSTIIQQRWRCIAIKAKKLFVNLQEELKQTQQISKQKFMQILSKNTRKRIDLQEIQYISLRCFNRQKSKTQVTLNIRQILKLLHSLNKKQIS